MGDDGHRPLYCTHVDEMEEKGSRYEHGYLPIKWTTTLILRRTDFLWPPYSPNLNPCDYFLWEYLKERTYDNNSQTLAYLKDNIRREIRRIPADMIVQLTTISTFELQQLFVKKVPG